MEILQWIGMIFGIFFLVYLSVMMLLRSEERLQVSKRAYRKNKQETSKLHEQLDATLVTLKDQNKDLKKVNQFFVKLNTRVFKK